MSLSTTRPITCLITDGTLTASNFDERAPRLIEIIRAASKVVSLIQIREKQLPARLLTELAKRAVNAARGGSAKLLVNDRADVAMAAGADGVHLTETSMPAASIRSFAPTGFLIGASVHTLDGALKAKTGGADFCIFGPVFNTPGKGTPAGIEQVAEVCAASAPFPVLGVGGIDESNYRSVLEHGAAGFAAIRFLNDLENLKKLDTR